MFVPAGHEDTGFRTDEWTPGTGPRYLDAVARLNKVLGENPGFSLGGFLWHQGEKDDANATAPSAYSAKFTAMIGALRRDVLRAGPRVPSSSEGHHPMSLPGLVVDIEARIDKLEKSFARANRAQNRASGRMERRARQSADRMSHTYGKGLASIEKSFAKLGSSLMGGLVAGATVAGVTASTASVRETVKSVAELGDQAKRACVDVKKFQQHLFVARENRIEVDAMVDGLKDLNLRADEWLVTGAGPAAESFQRLGFDATDLKRRLEDPAELFLEITRRLEGLDRAAQIRTADEVFGGTGGEQFVQLLGRGRPSCGPP